MKEPSLSRVMRSVYNPHHSLKLLKLVQVVADSPYGGQVKEPERAFTHTQSELAKAECLSSLTKSAGHHSCTAEEQGESAGCNF